MEKEEDLGSDKLHGRADGKGKTKKDVVARRLLPRASGDTGQAFDDLTFLSG